MSPASQAPKHLTNRRLSHLSRQLGSNFPLLGPIFRQSALQILKAAAFSGNVDAATILFQALASTAPPELLVAFKEILTKKSSQRIINTAWRVWQSSRNTALANILINIGKPATQPASLRLISLLKFPDAWKSLIQSIPQEALTTLSIAVNDDDLQVSQSAHHLIEATTDIAAIDTLTKLWFHAPDPQLFKSLSSNPHRSTIPPHGMFFLLIQDQLDTGYAITTEQLPALCLAIHDQNPRISNHAIQLLSHLQNNEAIKSLCLAWVRNHDPILKVIIAFARYLPTDPVEARMAAALVTSRSEVLENCPPNGVGYLVSEIHSTDQEIASKALDAIKQLHLPESQELACQIYIETGDQRLLSLIVEAGYQPKSPLMQALFLFLACQFQAYDELDFDHRLMASAFQKSTPHIRQRIADLIQSTGRKDYLDIIRTPTIEAVITTDEEIDTWLRVYKDHGEWQRIWDLSCEASPEKSLHMLEILAQSGWQPQNEAERREFRQMVDISSSINLSTLDLFSTNSCAIPTEILNVRHRVNAVAFTPGQPRLVMATGNRKVIFWDYQRGQIDHVVSNFDHTIGQIVYSTAGHLYCSEKSNRNIPCTIYQIDGHEMQPLGSHLSPVTGLVNFSSDRLISSGRDSKVIVWDTHKRTMLQEITTSDWARCIALDPDSNFLYTLHHRTEIIDLNNPTSQHMLIDHTHWQNGPKTAVKAILPLAGGNTIALGDSSGQVTQCVINFQKRRVAYSSLYQHQLSVRALARHSYPDQSLFSTGVDGRIHYYNATQHKRVGFAESQGESILSMVISHNGRYMATGTASGNLILWDLGLHFLPHLIQQPLSSAGIDTLHLVVDLLNSHQLSEKTTKGLQFIHLQLQRKFQYDIQLGEAPGMVPGTYDIIVEDP